MYLNSNGTISGRPSQRAVSDEGHLSVKDPIIVTGPGLPRGFEGEAYTSLGACASGGVGAPFTFFLQTPGITGLAIEQVSGVVRVIKAAHEVS
ncbi:hypothetical protein ACQU0X_27110 [Pseudovibrio ascidiaceicola]|uniref:hypothetical protein n=1 Tax=Pseudovibrio ascidiaceicola TaxID=285279 RepID=UPI003D35ABBE